MTLETVDDGLSPVQDMHFPLSCISSNDPVEWPLSWQWRGDCTVDRGGRGRIIHKTPRYSPLCAANHSSAVLSKEYQPSWMCQALWGSQWFLSLWSAQRSRAAWKDPTSQSSRMVSPQGWVLWGVRVSFVWEVVFGLSLKWQWGSCWPIYKEGGGWGGLVMLRKAWGEYKGIGTAVVR